MGPRTSQAGIHASPSRFLKNVPYFFLIVTGEKSKQPTKHAYKKSYRYFNFEVQNP